MALSDPVNGMHHLFAAVIAPPYFAASPPSGFDRPLRAGDLSDIENMLATNEQQIAAVILEPVVQGTGGMRIYNPQYLDHLRRICDALDILLIFDEIATGFARTGPLFATFHSQIEPDILCLGKALTGGMLNLAATLCSDKVAAGIAADGQGVADARTDLHGQPPGLPGRPCQHTIAVSGGLAK